MLPPAEGEAWTHEVECELIRAGDTSAPPKYSPVMVCLCWIDSSRLINWITTIGCRFSGRGDVLSGSEEVVAVAMLSVDWLPEVGAPVY